MKNSESQKTFSDRSFVWTLLALFVIYCFLKFFLIGFLSAWMERHGQQQEVLHRVQSVGGWTALKRDCDSLAEKYKDDPYGFTWWPGVTNSLPSAIAALKPKEVDFYSTSSLSEFGEEGIRLFGSNAVVRIRIFGAHATGGHDQPSLGLDVYEHEIANYPKRLRSTTPLRYWRYQKIEDGIYEFY